MALRIRRGLLQNLGSMSPPPAEGELFYTTDTKGLYVGDANGHTNLVSSSVVKVNNYVGVVELKTDDIPETGSPTNKWFTDERAQDAIWLALNAGNSSNTGITFSYDDSTNKITAVVSYPGSGTVSTGTTNALAYYTGNTSTVANAAELLWNNVSKTLTVNESLVTVNTSVDAKTVLRVDSYTSTFQGLTRFRRARGNINAPTALQSGDGIHTLIFDSYDGSAYNTSGGISVSVGSGAAAGKSPGYMTFAVANTDGAIVDSVRIDQLGRLVVGPFISSMDGLASGAVTIVQTRSSLSEFPTVNIVNNYSDTNGSRISFTKSRGTFATPTVVQTNDILGNIEYYGSDGSTYPLSAEIKAIVSGSVSTGIVPTDLKISVANSSGSLINSLTVSATNVTFATQAKFPDGTVSSPSIAFTTDGGVDTGFYHPGDGVIVVSCNATEVARFDNGGVRSTGFIKVKNYGSGAAPSPAEAGMIILKDGTFQGYNGSAWVTLG